MTFQISIEHHANEVGLDDTIYVLSHATSSSVAEVWPALGFNCYRWVTSSEAGALDLLYADPKLFSGGRPTRSGIPILFPFPNRIRKGQFTWDGKSYQLPLNDPVKKNAIHGFPCRKPWRVVEHGADAQSAWIRGEFQGSVDAPESANLWPADYLIRVTYRLGVARLAVESKVTAPGPAALPFGLGFHPYIRIPFVTGGDPADYRVQCAARQFWKLTDNLPTGKRKPVDGPRDLRQPRSFTDFDLDDVFTDLVPGVKSIGAVLDNHHGVGVSLRAAPAYRDVVVFTPPHREAVCLEPYTCPTDAVNLQATTPDIGWQVLQPGASWEATFAFEV